MSQMSSLPQMKPLALTGDKLKPKPCEKTGASPKIIDYVPEPDGRPIYRAWRLVTHNREPVLDESGEHSFRRDSRTGMKIQALYHAVPVYEEREFVMYDRGNGNAFEGPVPTSAAEMEHRREVQGKVDDFLKDLAESAMEEGMSVKDLVASIKAEKAPEAEPMKRKRGRPPKATLNERTD